MLSAKDESTARWGCILGYIIAGPICILTAIIGMMARAKTADLGDGATAFAWAIKDMSSPVMAGIIFAGATMIIAATMATMMMATGTVLTNVYKTQINTSASDETILKVSRIGTIVVAYLSLAVGFIIPSAAITDMFLTYMVTSPFSYSVIVGMFWNRVTAKASLCSVLAGMATAIIWVFAGLNGTVNVVYPTIAVSYVVGIIATLVTSPAETAK